jgi:hypothetical protein
MTASCSRRIQCAGSSFSALSRGQVDVHIQYSHAEHVAAITHVEVTEGETKEVGFDSVGMIEWYMAWNEEYEAEEEENRRRFL